jgi:hypothetical protein
VISKEEGVLLGGGVQERRLSTFNLWILAEKRNNIYKEIRFHLIHFQTFLNISSSTYYANWEIKEQKKVPELRD